MIHLVSWVSEREYFRFGDGGRLCSERRFRIPAAVEGTPIAIQVSVVQSSTLGALLGKDFIKVLGMKIDFESDYFDSVRLGLCGIPLSELQAGHYKLPLTCDPPRAWGGGCDNHDFTWLGIGDVVGRPKARQPSAQSDAQGPLPGNAREGNSSVPTSQDREEVCIGWPSTTSHGTV